MKIGFQLVLYIIILNMTCGLLYNISAPATGETNILAGQGDPQDYADRFNTTRFLNETTPSASAIYTYTGHIWSALLVVWSAIRFVVAGFPYMLIQIGGEISDPTAKLAFTSFSYVLGATFSLIILMWLFQVLTGREVE